MNDSHHHALLSKLLVVRDLLESGESITAGEILASAQRQGLTADDVTLALRIMRVLDVVRAGRAGTETLYTLNK